MINRHVRVLRVLALCAVPVWFVVLFRYGMAPEQHEVLLLLAGAGFVAALVAFFATLAYGPLAFPRGSREASLAKALLLVLSLGLAFVLSGLARKLLGWVAAAA
ncbi:hypothetical protein [Lysobacter humi (ex Lee et al. 2017)]